ncbi:MAG: hypothetical protein KJO08_05910, partial [Gammaproteobacteria bacterium]|nr:hypothetical protein [Gammaproteobacteria bacterium]
YPAYVASSLRNPMQTNVEIPDRVANELFMRAPRSDDRSALLESILKEYFESHPVKCSEIELINDHADELKREATDVLDYQVIP